jgi:hypothetical protein
MRLFTFCFFHLNPYTPASNYSAISNIILSPMSKLKACTNYS